MSFHQILRSHPVPTLGIEAAVGHKLDDKSLKKLLVPERPVKLTDGGGLYLHRLPSGVQTWRIKYRIGGKADEVMIGRFPDMTLKEARDDAAAVRRLAAAGTDPRKWAAEIEAQAQAEKLRLTETFRVVAEAYFTAKSGPWTSTHQRDVRRILDELIEGRTSEDKPRHAAIGDIPMRDLRKSHVRDVLDAVVARGALTYARDVLTYARKVVEFYNAGHDEAPIADPTVGLRDILPAADADHHAALSANEMPGFLAALRIARSEPETRIAIRLLLLTGLRTTELRLGEWSEIDTENKKWVVPGTRMKYRRAFVKRNLTVPPHEVPLSRQALAALEDLRKLTGDRVQMFPGVRGGDAVMSEATMLNAIKRMGYTGRMTGHGTRSVFSTWAHDAGYDSTVVERALSHLDEDAVRAAYDRGDRWHARVELMQAWADRLDAWEAGSNVVSPAVWGGATSSREG